MQKPTGEYRKFQNRNEIRKGVKQLENGPYTYDPLRKFDSLQDACWHYLVYYATIFSAAQTSLKLLKLGFD